MIYLKLFSLFCLLQSGFITGADVAVDGGYLIK